MAEPLRPLSLGQLLDRAVQLYRRNFALFVGIAVPALFLVVGSEVIPRLLGLPPTTTRVANNPFPVFNPAGIWTLLATSIIGIIVNAYVTGATVWAVSDLETGAEAGIGRAYAKIRGHAAPVIGVSLLVSACSFGAPMLGVVAMSLVMLISPLLALPLVLVVLASCVFAIWFLLRMAAAVPAVILERPGVFAALRRSWLLTKGHAGRILLVLLTVVCFYFAILVIFGYTGGTLIRVTHTARLLEVATIATNSISALLATPLLNIAFVLLYFDFKVRKEGFDLEVLLRQGQTAPEADA